jgi:hypothetical protein
MQAFLFFRLQASLPHPAKIIENKKADLRRLFLEQHLLFKGPE